MTGHVQQALPVNTGLTRQLLPITDDCYVEQLFHLDELTQVFQSLSDLQNINNLRYLCVRNATTL